MIVICIESSHQRGMGHFYRALNIIEYLKGANEQAVIAINKDKVSVQILENKKILYEVVDYADITSNWEKRIIKKYQADTWLLDKFETGLELVKHVKHERVLLAAIDDCGVGAELVDLHFCSMLFTNLKGKHIYSGLRYLILNPDIKKYRQPRRQLNKIIVTLGGSDTYGVTVEVVRILKETGYCADVIIGPNFSHKDELKRETNERFNVYEAVPSLIAAFSRYDLAITGGGVSCFEANASGLPCIIIANEQHEIETGKYLASFGGAMFAGYYKNISRKTLDISSLNIEEMSASALQAVPLDGLNNVYTVIRNYRRKMDEG